MRRFSGRRSRRVVGRELWRGVEELEPRQLLSAATALSSALSKMLLQMGGKASSIPPAKSTLMANKKHGAIPHYTSPPAGSFTPAQIRHAYGMDQVTFGSTAGDGSGQTIALIDAYYYPSAASDLAAFDAQFGLAAPPSFTQVSETGGDPSGQATNVGWSQEAALDIEWAHVMAPAASLILVACNTNNYSDLINSGVDWARKHAGVSVISMSFGSAESGLSASFETSTDPIFTTPAGHNGVTFVASTGDDGAPGGYPAYSPNVVAVGGTTLTIDSQGNYISEAGWADGGGGVSQYESKPAYQSSVTQSSTRRTEPDVAMDADPNSGVPVFDSFANSGGGNWFYFGGTSLASPLFAGVMAVVDQGRVMAGVGTLDGPTQTLPMLYSLSPADFHDITTGSNGSGPLASAGPGYDLVTGLGSPITTKFVPDMIGVGSINGHVYQDNNDDGANDAGDTPLAGVTVFLDANNNGVLDSGGNQMQSSGTLNAAIPDKSTTGISSSVTVSGLTSAVSHVTVTLNITHPRDSDLSAYLIGPNGAQVTLFSLISGAGSGFVNTTFDDLATNPITSGSAPFTGPFKPTSALATFNGILANGIWTLKVTDTVGRVNRVTATGTLNSWSINVSTAPEASTATAADGSYAFPSLTLGAYIVREVVPAGFVATTPVFASPTVGLSGATVNFGLFRTVFSSVAANDTFNVWLDPETNKIAIGKSGSSTNPLYEVGLSVASQLTFDLTSPGGQLIVDFTHGSPLAGTTILLDGGGFADSQLVIVGAGASLVMTDAQIGPAGQGAVQYQNLAAMTLENANVAFTGTLSNLQNLALDSGTNFTWY